jgi:hypothetical protein
MPHGNERAEITLEILNLLRQLRGVVLDDDIGDRLRTQIAELEGKLRQIDE